MRSNVAPFDSLNLKNLIMKTIETTVYNFSELSDSAKATAIEQIRQREYETGFNWGSEALDTLKAFLEHFNVKLGRYSIDWFNANGSDIRISFNDSNIEELSGVRLWKYLHNNGLLTYWRKYTKKTEKLLSGDCPFTGVCFDENCLDNIREFVKKPTNITFRELIEESIEKLLKDCEKDADYQFSDEGITEMIEANEYDFTEDGEIY